jgi:histidine triad (HIT) family protein
MKDPGCLFCKIAAREVPAEILRESDRVLAFRDIDPKAPTHILLIPKDHVASLADVTDGDGAMLADIVQAAAHLANAEGIADSGWRLVANVGRDAGQAVFHLHFHVLGGRAMSWPPG